MALCLGSLEQIRSSKERGFDPRPPQMFFCLHVLLPPCVFGWLVFDNFFGSLVPFRLVVAH